MTESEDYRLYLESRFDALTTLINANHIEAMDSLDKITTKVDEHEKIITVNLPHNINLCPQREIIETLKENMINNNAVKKTIIVGVSVIVSLITIIWGVTEIFL